ncbi:hypothetical protein HF679_16960 [Enterobacter sp. JUb54]|uniref:hypothetical protein n=1 Tax=Enterobacter sp. JUb54 TaxID=2724468 RepID=UPI00164E6960|nr:hypothetical protein [Enterobacter sp. JUb54]QNK06484.1 hypothetical protein HF679_16960 [Enterobacter sp. JUb54]
MKNIAAAPPDFVASDHDISLILEQISLTLFMLGLQVCRVNLQNCKILIVSI